ncbi:MAG: PAS domain-containing protein [Thermoleophilia bacterium]|nr:PAS domain-containing protein [Thermoleophilia bacterium]
MTLAGARLVTARRLVLTCLLEPAGDALGGDEDGISDAAAAYRSAADLLARIGWPDDPRSTVDLMVADAALIRFAALAGLGAVSEVIDEAASAAARRHGAWDADGAITEFEDIVQLLDAIGWPDGSGRRPPRSTVPPPPEDAQLMAFGERLPTPMYMWRDGCIHHRNPAALDLLRRRGLTPGDAPVVELVHPEDRPALAAHISAAEAEQRPFRAEIRFASGEGVYRRLTLSGAPRFATDGAFLGFVVLAVDSPSGQSGLLHWGTGPDGELTGATTGFLGNLGLELPHALGDGWQAAIHPDDRARLRAALETAHRDGAALRVGVRARTCDGGWRPVRLLAEPRLEACGFAGLTGVMVPADPGDGDLR